MNLVNRFSVILMSVLVIKGILGHEAQIDDLSDNLINDLYKKYKEAMKRGGDLVILRRQFDHNQLFEIHVKKLKEVNGFKLHNLMIKGKLRSGSPFIYIDNPVESKMPNAYLTLEEFKEALTKRVQKSKQTTVKIIDVFFTTKTANKRIDKTLHTQISVVNKNRTNDSKTTTEYILRLSHTNTSLGKGKHVNHSFPSTDATTRKQNIFSNASTESITVLNTYNSIPYTTSKIRDLLFLRNSPTNDNYTQIEKYNISYSKVSVDTVEKYENTTVFINRTLPITHVERNTLTYANDSPTILPTERMKLNINLVFTSESSKLVNVTEIQNVENTELDISNKTIEIEKVVNVMESIIINNHDKVHKGIESGNNTTSVTILESSGINNTDTSQNTSLISNFIIKTTTSKLSKDNVTKASTIFDNPITFMDTTTKDIALRTNAQLNKNQSEIFNTTTDKNITEENADNLTKYPTNITTYMAEINYDKTDSNIKLESPTEPVSSERNNTQLTLNQNFTLIETLEKSKRVPKHAVTQPEAPFGRQTPWRRRTKTRNITKNTTAKTKRSTLGRPLVFIGGP